MRESACCGARVEDDSDICSDCGEHCQLNCPDCEDGFIEVIDELKVNSRTIDIPYKKVICPNCNGEGVIEAV